MSERVNSRRPAKSAPRMVRLERGPSPRKAIEEGGRKKEEKERKTAEEQTTEAEQTQRKTRTGKRRWMFCVCHFENGLLHSRGLPFGVLEGRTRWLAGQRLIVSGVFSPPAATQWNCA